MSKFERSGSTAAAFCRQHRLAYQTFLGWRRELAATTEASAAPEFVELEAAPREAGPTEAGGQVMVELVLGGGMVLRIHGPQGSRP